MTVPATPFPHARRRALLRGIGVGLAGLLPAGGVPTGDLKVSAGAGSSGGAIVPPAVIRLADHGGRPGASPEVLVAAFRHALAALAALGGGTLMVSAGRYDFGRLADARPVILCRDTRNVAISAYGALFRVASAARTMPHLFYFFNFANVTIAGASFVDDGFSPWIDWQGMYCAGIQADVPSAGFRMVDCNAERVLGLLAAHNDARARHLMSAVAVQGAVRHAYYGVGANYIHGAVDIDLACHNVRRAVIAYGLRDARLAVRVSCCAGWPGSNGLVALVSGGTLMGDVEDVQVQVDVRGYCIHKSYVHFYHQGPAREGRMRDIDATVNLVDVSGAPTLFTFDHENDGIAPRTSRTWDRISLHGNIVGPFTGSIVSNPSASDSPGTVWLDRNLARRSAATGLAPGFRSWPP